MSAIQIQNLKKYFGTVKAVDDISFSVEEGEIFGYLGPNGAGKSTTIACMMGFIKPTAGTISIFGKDAQTSRTELKHDIGYLSPDVHLYNNLTGKEHFDLIQKVRGKSEILPQLLEDFGFNPNVKVAHLSTGTKQKLGLILCLMNTPKLLLLDEPTRGLDPLLQNKVYEYILAAKQKGTTIFMSSHIISEVEKLCDRIGIIRAGKLVEVETVASIREKKVYTYKVYFEKTPDLKKLQIPGIEDINKMIDGGVEFHFKGDIDKLLKLLSQYNVLDLEVSHLSLEEVFMKYYA